MRLLVFQCLYAVLILLDINECDGSHGCGGNCVNTIGGFYCNCPETHELGSNLIEVYTEEIPESQCTGFPDNHVSSYSCSNEPYGLGECRCPEESTGNFKLVANTGGCLGKYRWIKGCKSRKSRNGRKGRDINKAFLVTSLCILFPELVNSDGISKTSFYVRFYCTFRAKREMWMALQLLLFMRLLCYHHGQCWGGHRNSADSQRYDVCWPKWMWPEQRWMWACLHQHKWWILLQLLSFSIWNWMECLASQRQQIWLLRWVVEVINELVGNTCFTSCVAVWNVTNVIVTSVISRWHGHSWKTWKKMGVKWMWLFSYFRLWRMFKQYMGRRQLCCSKFLHQHSRVLWMPADCRPLKIGTTATTWR